LGNVADLVVSHPGSDFYDDFEEFIAHDGLDAISVCTPNAMLSVGQTQRFYPAHVKAREILKKGREGPIGPSQRCCTAPLDRLPS